MESIYRNILKQYWGYENFRSLQEEIIHSVAAGNDTLGLMPTGGGKSVTFQVYSLSCPGVCLVVTPLISLMKDQVENLKHKGIKAIAIHSGMDSREVNQAFNAVAWGEYKFLYLSPERISTNYFQERLAQLNVNLIAVDEAHCISQWGYDFRPSYLGIKTLRFLLPKVPVLALTATATPEVVKDIQVQLGFEKENILQKSFYRDNLVYVVRNREDRYKFLLQAISKVNGTGVVYARNRKLTREISDFLNSEGISADYYHAGLTPPSRAKKQEDWKEGRTRVIVATNAFGMGIDKADVRFVIHLSPPDSLEAYFQEAGRAGRDGKLAYALLVASSNDKGVLNRKVENEFPPIEFIKQVYEFMGSYFQIAIGTGGGVQRDFDVSDFCKLYGYSISRVMGCLKVLQRQGLIEFSLSSYTPSKVHFKIRRDELYEFNHPNIKLENFIRELLRYDGGMFTIYVPIDEEKLALKVGITTKEVKQFLAYLSKLKILHYIPRRTNPFITYTRERLPRELLRFSPEHYSIRKEEYQKRIDASIQYAYENTTCRSVKLLQYFGEKDAKPCGKCDVCNEQNIKPKSIKETQTLIDVIQHLLSKNKELTPQELLILTQENEKELYTTIRLLMSEGIVVFKDNGKLQLVS